MSHDHRTDAPVPRDHDKATFSEIMPIRSGKISLRKSPLLSLGIVSALVVVALFGIAGLLFEGGARMRQEGFITLTFVLIAYFLFLILWMVRFYARTDRTMFYFAWPFFVVCLILITPALGWPFFWFFREVLPGNAVYSDSNVFHEAFIGHFFGAGLMEELLKGVPILIGAAITMWGLRGKVADYFRVRGPLDGVLMGLGAGAGFVFIETGGQYVPNFTELVAREVGNEFAGFTFGATLLIPRVFQGLSGHMGWCAIFGYFIGLALLRPNSRWLLLLVGWLLSSVIHALWNSGGTIHVGVQYAVAVVGFLLFLACLLKARQLEASIFGRGADQAGGSIVVGAGDPMPASPMPASPMPASPTPQPGAAPGNQWPPASPSPGAPPPPSPTAQPSPGNAPTQPVTGPGGGATQPMTSQMGYTLSIGGNALPLAIGQDVDLDAQSGQTSGVRFEVTQHPRNKEIVGLKNTGTATWNVTLTDGSQRELPPGKNVRLARGVTIDFAGVSGAVG